MLTFAMIGGGPGSFIGPVHRIAAELDRSFRLVAGAFSSSPEKSKQAGETYGLSPDRAYSSIDELIQGERRRPDPADMIAIVTPNHMHFPAARAALEAGFPVMCDKPMTLTLGEAETLERIVRRTGIPFGLTHTYSGYPLVREMKDRIAKGEIGKVRKIAVEYLQGWLSDRTEDTDNRQAAWRTDPKRSGVGGCIGDIGTHAFHLAEFVTGLRTTEMLADLDAVVPGRALDDDCSILLRYENGARGSLLSSQIAFGERNGLFLRVYGDRGAMEWRQEEPNSLTIHRPGGLSEIIHAATAAIGDLARAATRIPAGHPEGYLEAFANLYRDFAEQIRVPDSGTLVPGVIDGVRGMRFIETAVRASQERSGWVSLKHGE